MHSPLPFCGLYAITPDLDSSLALLQMAKAALSGGCRWLQYRNKTASQDLRREQATILSSLCRFRHAGLIVNDDILLARDVGAAGVHLGDGDGDIKNARDILGEKAIIGISCYQDFTKARTAAENGADYIAFGAIYPSPSKPLAKLAPLSLLERAKKELSVPVCAIGGITLENAAPVIVAGADLLAVISGLFSPGRTLLEITDRANAYQKLFKDIL